MALDETSETRNEPARNEEGPAHTVNTLAGSALRIGRSVGKFIEQGFDACQITTPDRRQHETAHHFLQCFGQLIFRPDILEMPRLWNPIRGMHGRRLTASTACAFFSPRRRDFDATNVGEQGPFLQSIDMGESRRQGDLPVGVSNPFCDFAVKPHSRKYSYLRPGRRSSRRLMSCPERGALAIVTNVGMGCGGRGSVGRVIAIAGRFYVSDHAARGRTALQRLRQDFDRLHAGGGGIGGGCRVRQSRVVLAPVAGVKLAEVVRAQPGFDQPSICWRR